MLASYWPATSPTGVGPGGLLAALDTACLLTPRAWAMSARERVVSIFPDGGGSDRCQVAGLFLEGVLQRTNRGSSGG